MSREDAAMKKSTIWGIIAAVAVLAVAVTLLCIYMKDIKRIWTNFWDKWAAKRANLQVYM